MGVLDWVMFAVTAIILCVGVIMVVKLCKASAKLPAVNEEEFVCYKNATLTRKDIRCRVEGLNIPRTITEFVCEFLLETGKQVAFIIPETLFNQLEEEMQGNLYVKGGKFFDFEQLK